MSMFVKFDGLAQRRIHLARREQRHLRAVPIFSPHCLDNRARIDALVHIQRNTRHFKRRALRFSRPLQLRIEMRIVGVTLLLLWRF